MRKKQGGYGHKKRYGGGGGGHHHGGGHHVGGNRQRRNWGPAREKYLNQARDALSSGDRVLAENYLQHADHCWRMMMEENGGRPPQPRHQQQANGHARQNEGQDNNAGNDDAPGNASHLPSFITSGRSSEPVDPATIQNWEERDA